MPIAQTATNQPVVAENLLMVDGHGDPSQLSGQQRFPQMKILLPGLRDVMH